MAFYEAIEKREWTLEEWLNTELEPCYESRLILCLCRSFS